MTLDEKIKAFLTVSYGDGSGSGAKNYRLSHRSWNYT